jgi:SAM-dependent methyltransferase
MPPRIANVEMAAAWDGDEGADWARDWERYDRAVRGYHRRLLDAAAVGPRERVLDVGCGNGESTRDAARAAHLGAALGVDLSSRMIEQARERARVEGLDNVHFEQADAEVHEFESESRDVVLSRFGTMFFGDNHAAFANLAHAARPGGRLVMVAWRGLSDNEWMRAVRDALARGRDLPVPPVGAPGPFGLADPDGSGAMLRAAGWDEIEFDAVDEPFTVGVDGADAFAFVRSTGAARGMLQALDDADRVQALAALRATMEAHDTGDGVVFGSGVWLISARRPRR